MERSTTEHKKAFIEAALSQGMIQIHINTKIPEVALPAFLMAQDHAILNLSWKFGSYMELQETGIYASLSFHGQTEQVHLPWKAIWFVRLAGGLPVMFREDAPMDNLPASILGTPAEPPKLTLEQIEGDAELTPPRMGHLKLVH